MESFTCRYADICSTKRWETFGSAEAGKAVRVGVKLGSSKGSTEAHVVHDGQTVMTSLFLTPPLT